MIFFISIFIQQRCIKLIKGDSKDIYNITKDFYVLNKKIPTNSECIFINCRGPTIYCIDDHCEFYLDFKCKSC